MFLKKNCYWGLRRAYEGVVIATCSFHISVNIKKQWVKEQHNML